jgi:hypothetical protein
MMPIFLKRLQYTGYIQASRNCKLIIIKFSDSVLCITSISTLHSAANVTFALTISEFRIVAMFAAVNTEFVGRFMIYFHTFHKSS